MQKSQGTLKLLTKMSRFYETLLPVLRKFPKTQRYTLAQSIENEALLCVRLAFFAAYQKPRRLENLRSLRVSFHVLAKFIRLSSKANILPDTQYKILSEQINEMGKIVSQWIKTEERNRSSSTSEERRSS